MLDTVFSKKFKNAEFAVLKHNTIVESGYDLSPVPNNIMNIAITKARESNDPSLWNGEVVISAEEYSKIHAVSLSDAYRVLKKAVFELRKLELACDAYYDFSKQEVIPDLPPTIADAKFFSDTVLPSRPKHGKYTKMKLLIRLTQKVGYSDTGAFIYLKFTDDILHLIRNATKTDLEDYTKYNYAKTIDLNTTPAKRLYELAVKWKKIGNCRKSVDDWRILFGVFDKYPNVAEFKRWVLVPAIKQINEQGEFELVLEQEKLGRIITHFNILIKTKNVDETVVDASNTDTDEHNLTETESQIIKATADIYIIKNNIIDEKHKQNIYKKAISERWGLADYDKQQAELKAQSDKVIKQIEAEKQAEIEQKQEAEKQKLDNEQFIMLFESHSPQERMDILNEVKKLLSGIPVISTQFEKERADFTAHKNMMFRKHFKQVMGILDS
ncbi:RepB family plasmid replication initiator protein [bacterium M00.F.Ca.ET.230.01.1.1]|nr:RepB family plasmid replication initiator protein [bacterium M00.F.Ca.ET.230.01.1.1]